MLASKCTPARRRKGNCPHGTASAQTLNPIGQSLQKGAISGAQRALSPLQQTQQAQQTQVGGRHHHGDHGGGNINSGTASANTLTSSTDNSPTAGTTVDITA